MRTPRTASPTTLSREFSVSAGVAAFLVVTFAVRLISLFATGFCDDEAYVVAISRAPALSYFDHPPLHQWMLWAWTRLFGEGHAARLPFFACTLLTTLGLWGLTHRLFGVSAAWWAVFAFSASAYFLVYPDGYILPDAPLFAALTLGVWAVAEILFGPPGRETPLWLSAGLAFGLAGLAKYSAIFAPLGLAGYFATSPAARARLADWRPYVAAALALALLTPVVIWNARHGWVSFGFQTGRAARALSLSPKALAQILAAIGAQLGALTPWIAWPVVAGLAQAARSGAGTPERFLLWQALPPLIVFAAMPLMGVEPIAHWFNSGWLFAFPLAGAWLAARVVLFQRRFFAAAAALAGVVFAVYLGAVLLGPLPLARDPTRQMFDWPAAPLREALEKSGATFVAVENWRVGGRVGVALGPQVPICALGGDPRGFAFSCDAGDHLGQTALIVREHGHSQTTQPSAFFASVVPLGEIVFGRHGAAERTLDLERGEDLKSAPPLPYGP
jgi:4-amino-4-deoxy-L-arabinose transferase-like glycosyltransferase